MTKWMADRRGAGVSVTEEVGAVEVPGGPLLTPTPQGYRAIESDLLA